MDQSLHGLAKHKNLLKNISSVFGDEIPEDIAAGLRRHRVSDDDDLSAIGLARWASPGDTNAADAAANTIRVAPERLQGSDPDPAAALTLPEYGDAVDEVLNPGSDARGGEGALFAPLAMDPDVSPVERAVSAAQEDAATVMIDGAATMVEQDLEPAGVMIFSSAVHVFSINDILGGFDGRTYTEDPTIIALGGTADVPTLIDKDGDVLSPIDSEFGFFVTDFVGAEDKVRDDDYREGWAGNILDAGQVVGLALANAVTDTFKSGQPLGTWAAGLGGNSVKASTEHYNVMAALLSDQRYPDDEDAKYALDNNLRLRTADPTDEDPFIADLLAVSGDVNGDGVLDVRDVLTPNESTTSENIAYSEDYSVTMKDDGKLLYRWGTEVKRPNDIRMDVKLELPDAWMNDADLDTNGVADVAEINGGLGYRVTRAELIINHNITNNPNDQIRPEDYENEGATGRGPSYYIVVDPDDPTNKLWVSGLDSYDGSGAFLPSYFKLTDTGEIDLSGGGVAVFDPAGNLVGYRNTDASGTLIGTVFRDMSLIGEADDLVFSSADLDEGFTNAWYTTTDRDPFEWSYDAAADDPYRQLYVGFRSREEAEAAGFTEAELISGPRWRLTSNKFGQDLPGVEIPLVDNSQPPYQSNNILYPTGERTTTILNLLDFEDLDGDGIADSPLLFSTGWTMIDPTRLDVDVDGLIDAGWSAVNGALNAGDAMPDGPILTAVTNNGLRLTPEFLDTAVYLKGDRQDSAKIFDIQLVLEFEGDPATAVPALAPQARDIEIVALAAAGPGQGNGPGDGTGAGEGNGNGQGPGGGGGHGGGNEVVVQDVDEPLNQNPDYVASYVFSTADVTGTFDGLTQGDVVPGERAVIDFTATPRVTKEGVELFPINSEFGFLVTDFEGAVEKDFDLNPEYAEGWAGDLTGANGEQLGIVVSDAPTDTFKTPAKLGTWLIGMGGDAVKADSEHYSVMQNVLSDQRYPGDPDALYPLDDALYVIGGANDGRLVADVIAELQTAGNDVNGDGRYDIRDVLAPNENSIEQDIAASRDYSVTLKDDGKLLYRWGNLIKRPNDVRIEAELPLPDEWSAETDPDSGLAPLYFVTAAELVVRHTITNNPNDQIRPEDYENEAAIGRLPAYVETLDGKWITTEDFYAGDGTFLPAGTVLKDPALAFAAQGSALAAIGALSEDLQEGFTVAYYITQDREPFEPVLDENGEYLTGPRWRLKTDKYGQDLPSVQIPLDPSAPPPPTQGEVKYEVGAETQTVLNLLDWEGISPLTLSAGWRAGAGTVSGNGLNLTENFDVAFYVKGDQKPVTLYGADLVMSYEKADVAEKFAAVVGDDGDEVLAGKGGNTFVGGGGEDLFVLSYGATGPAGVVVSTIGDFTDGEDALGLIGLGVTEDDFRDRIAQTVETDGIAVALDGVALAKLVGVFDPLGLEDFLLLPVTQPENPPDPNTAPVTQDDAFDIAYGVALSVPAAGVLANDSDADGDPLTAQLVSGPVNGVLTLNDDGSFDYAPNVGFSGEDSFTYAAFDGAKASDPATVTIDVGDPVFNVIAGSRPSQVLRGTDGPDVLLMGSSRSVRMFGEEDMDIFVCGETVGNGVREIAYVRDYEVGLDMIDLSGATPINIVESGGKVSLIFNDADTMIVYGAANFDQITFTTDWSDGLLV